MLNLLLGLLISTISLPPKPTRYVTDNAAVLPAAVAAALDEKLKSFERDTSNQVIVYIDTKVPEGTTLEEMGAEAIRQWRVGQKGKNNGVILFLFTEQRKMRIEVGYGLEGTLTDAKSKLITSTIIKPRLREGDYAGAVEHGVAAILNTVRAEGNVGSGRTVAEANAAATNYGGGLSLLIFVAIFGSFIFFLTLGRKRGWVTVSSSTPSGGWSSGDSSSSSSDSGGDFSGGGGDGGGGGASDSW